MQVELFLCHSRLTSIPIIAPINISGSLWSLDVHSALRIWRIYQQYVSWLGRSSFTCEWCFAWANSRSGRSRRIGASEDVTNKKCDITCWNWGRRHPPLCSLQPYYGWTRPTNTNQCAPESQVHFDHERYTPRH